MKYTVLRYALAVLFVSGLIGSAYAQGLYWELVTTGGALKANEQMTARMCYMPKKFRMDMVEEGGFVVVRLDKQMIYSVDTKAKTYSETTFADLEKAGQRAGAKLDAAIGDMQKQLEEMPEEQRKMVEQMMGKKMPGKRGGEMKVEVVAAGDRRTISGYGCTKYVVKVDGEESATVWATKDVGGFGTMRKDFEEFQKRMAALIPTQGKGMADGLRSVDGFPIETETGNGMKSVVTKIEKKSFPSSQFEVPAGYVKAKKSLFEMDVDEGGKEEP